MLRYIYLLCFFLHFELVFSYNSVKSNSRPHRSVKARIRRRPYGSEDSPLANLDLVNFMQKPEDPEDFESYGFDSKRRQSNDENYATLKGPATRMRRSRHKLSANDLDSARMSHHQQPSHLARRLNRKSSFSKFPFFSHNNKSKPGTIKHNKRKSHSFRFSKHKQKQDRFPSTPPNRTPEYEKSHLDLQINAIPKTERTTEKRMSPNCKMKMTRVKKSLPNIIHNSRQYFANRYKINDTDRNKIIPGRDIKNYSKRERVSYVNYEGNNRDTSIGDKTDEAGASKGLSTRQKEQQKELEDLESRLRESYHVLRNLF